MWGHAWSRSDLVKLIDTFWLGLNRPRNVSLVSLDHYSDGYYIYIILQYLIVYIPAIGSFAPEIKQKTHCFMVDHDVRELTLRLQLSWDLFKVTVNPVKNFISPKLIKKNHINMIYFESIEIIVWLSINGNFIKKIFKITIHFQTMIIFFRFSNYKPLKTFNYSVHF